MAEDELDLPEDLLPPPRPVPAEHAGSGAISLGPWTAYSNLRRPPEVEGRPRSRDGTLLPCGLKCTARCRDGAKPFCASLSERQREVLLRSPGLMVKEAMAWRDERVADHVSKAVRRVAQNHAREMSELASAHEAEATRAAGQHAAALRDKDREMNWILAWFAGSLLLCLVLLTLLLGATH